MHEVSSLQCIHYADCKTFSKGNNLDELFGFTNNEIICAINKSVLKNVLLILIRQLSQYAVLNLNRMFSIRRNDNEIQIHSKAQ